MNKIFEKLCVPLMLINGNVYTFISGIIISLATGTVNTLCIEKIPFYASWHLYASTVFYTFAGAMLIYIPTRLSSIHKYIADSNITNYQEQKSVMAGVEVSKCHFWIFSFLSLILSLVLGTVMMFFNYNV